MFLEGVLGEIYVDIGGIGGAISGTRFMNPDIYANQICRAAALIHLSLL